MKTKQNFITDIMDNAQLVHRGKHTDPINPPEFLDWNHYIADTTPEPPHIIGRGILPQKSLMLIAGEPKVGKSHLTMNLAYHMATGSQWFNFPISHPQKILLLQAENSYFNQRRRIQTINQLTQPPYNLPKCPQKQLFISHPIHNTNINESGGYQAIYTAILQHQPNVIIVDPLVNFHSGEENSNSEMAQVMQKLHELKDDTGVSIILVHHTRKPSGNDSSGVSMRGASSIRGSYDTGLTLTHQTSHTGQHYHQLEFEIRNGEPINPLTLDLDSTCLTFFAINLTLTAKDYILEQLNEAKEDGIKQSQLILMGQEEGYAKSTMLRNIKALINNKTIKQSPDERNKILYESNYYNELPL